jgi:hypothetical protein
MEAKGENKKLMQSTMLILPCHFWQGQHIVILLHKEPIGNRIEIFQ